MIESIFVILPSQENACIFYGQIDQSEDSEDLGNILGVVVEYAQRVDNNQVKSIRISQGKFAYGKFNDIYIISKIEQSAEMDEVKTILTNMAKGFLEKFNSQIESSNGDPSAYEGFSSEIQSYLQSKPAPIKKSAAESEADLESKIAEKPQEKSKFDLAKPKLDKSGTDYLKAEKPMQFEPTQMPKETEFSNKSPIIQPAEREAYADGLADYMKDEVLWNESQEVMKEYTAEFVDNIISKLEIYLSISITHHYKVIIDFQNYPEEPKFPPTDDFTEAVIAKVKEKSYFLANWDVKVPPHVIELVREIEAILSKLKSIGELDSTTEMPAAAMPELEPLEKLPPLDDDLKAELKKKQKKSKETKTISEPKQPAQSVQPQESNDQPKTQENQGSPPDSSKSEEKKEKKKKKRRKDKK